MNDDYLCHVNDGYLRPGCISMSRCATAFFVVETQPTKVALVHMTVINVIDGIGHGHPLIQRLLRFQRSRFFVQVISNGFVFTINLTFHNFNFNLKFVL